MIYRGAVEFTEYDTRLAAYALIVSPAQEVLLTWFNGLGGASPCWSLPGGGVEFDESVSAAVLREVHEETGYRVQVGHLLAEHHFTLRERPRGRPFRSQRFIFAATIVGGQLGTVEVGGSTDRAAWVPLSAARELEPRADIVGIALQHVSTPE